ncbi:MAG: hypothetical protein WA888_18430, partial [Burkholderiaceae bacterium]
MSKSPKAPAGRTNGPRRGGARGRAKPGGKRSDSGPGPGKGTGGSMRHWLARAATAALAGDQPADLALREVLAAHRQIGSRDRRRIADRCFAILRYRRSLMTALEQAGADAADVNNLLILADARFGNPLLPAPDAPVAWLEKALNFDAANGSPGLRFDLPDWLVASLQSQLGAEHFESAAQALLQTGSLDLRVNLARRSREEVREALQRAGIETIVPGETGDGAGAGLSTDTLLRVPDPAAVEKTQAFRDGFFEVQDAGSQMLTRLAGPKRNQTIVDFCAGAGGKTLAMADATRDTGNLYACDASARRLGRLSPRVLRAGLRSIRPLAIDSENDARLARLLGRADLVFVDA